MFNLQYKPPQCINLAWMKEFEPSSSYLENEEEKKKKRKDRNRAGKKRQSHPHVKTSLGAFSMSLIRALIKYRFYWPWHRNNVNTDGKNTWQRKLPLCGDLKMPFSSPTLRRFYGGTMSDRSAMKSNFKCAQELLQFIFGRHSAFLAYLIFFPHWNCMYRRLRSICRYQVMFAPV